MQKKLLPWEILDSRDLLDAWPWLKVSVQRVQLPDGKVEEREVGPGTLVHIPTALYHSTVNNGDVPMELIAVYAPFGPEAELRELDGVAIEPPVRVAES